MQAYNVMFSIDDSYSVENWEVADPNTGEMVKLQIAKPIFSALKESLQNLVEGFKTLTG